MCGFKDNCEAILPINPVVFEVVVFDQDTKSSLQLEQILNQPNALPFHRFVKVIAAYHDVAWECARNLGISSAETYVLPGGLEIIILYEVRPCPVPAADRLGIGTAAMNLADI